MEEELRVVVVGGSIGGLSCALALFHHHQRGRHQLLQAGAANFALHVVVLEKVRSLTAAGAGLGLDPPSCTALLRWGLPLLTHTLPLSSEQNRVVNGITKQAFTVAKDQHFGYRAAHWSDLHRMLYEALPPGTVLWDHEVISFEEAGDNRHVKVHFKRGSSSSVRTLEGNILIAADGSMSETRMRFLPQEKRRYCGYCAWRGVLDTSTEVGLKVKTNLLREYPDLGHCLYFDIAEKTHAALYELPKNRLNWLWYANQREPNLKGSSVTAKANEEAIRQMRIEAERVWLPELASLMKQTPAPFINAIFDREPLKQIVWGRVVLVGEAAHPTSPHGLRSTNMSILDADILGECLAKWSWQVDGALRDYEALRLPVTSQQVLFSRHLGRAKQGLLSWQLQSLEGFQWDALLQRNMHSFGEDTSEDN